MMISPESYYHMELEGKSVSQIEKSIRKLKKEMASLKKAIESSHSDEPRILMEPSLDVQLKCTRGYLERAKTALVEAGGKYIPNQAEQRVIDFDNNIEFISKIRFDIGGFFTGNQIILFLEIRLIGILADLVLWILNCQSIDQRPSRNCWILSESFILENGSITMLIRMSLMVHNGSW